jgi:hypothetical protein
MAIRFSTTRLQDNKRYEDIAPISAHILRLNLQLLVKLDPLIRAILRPAHG